MNHVIKLESTEDSVKVFFEEEIKNLGFQYEKLNSRGGDGAAELVIVILESGILESGVAIAALNTLKGIVVALIERDAVKSFSISNGDDNVTISGHTGEVAEKLLSKYLERTKKEK